MQLRSHCCACSSSLVPWCRRNYRLGNPCFHGALDKSTQVQNSPVCFIDCSLLNKCLILQKPREWKWHSQGPAGRLKPETWCESTQLSQIFCKMPPKEDQRKIYLPVVNFYYQWVLFLISTQAFIISVVTISTLMVFTKIPRCAKIANLGYWLSEMKKHALPVFQKWWSMNPSFTLHPLFSICLILEKRPIRAWDPYWWLHSYTACSAVSWL